MDRRRARPRYLGGADYGSADSAVFPWLRSCMNQGIDWDEHPHFKGWFDEIGGRPAVQRGVAVLADRRRPLVDDRAREVLFGETQYRRHA
jgi:GST-like protein